MSALVGEAAARSQNDSGQWQDLGTASPPALTRGPRGFGASSLEAPPPPPLPLFFWHHRLAPRRSRYWHDTKPTSQDYCRQQDAETSGHGKEALSGVVLLGVVLLEEALRDDVPSIGGIDGGEDDLDDGSTRSGGGGGGRAGPLEHRLRAPAPQGS